MRKRKERCHGRKKREKTNGRKGKSNRGGWSKIDDYDVEKKKK